MENCPQALRPHPSPVLVATLTRGTIDRGYQRRHLSSDKRPMTEAWYPSSILTQVSQPLSPMLIAFFNQL
jgi:hypothetical protein